MADQTICVFGDSTEWGAWDLEKGGWINRLRLWTDQQNVIDGGDFYAPVYNQGVSGDTTADMLERFDVEAEAREPSIIIFSIGDNDSAGRKDPTDHRVPPEQFVKNLEKIVEKARKYTDKIVFLGLKLVDESLTNPVPWDKEARYTVAASNKYDLLLQNALTKQGVLYLSFENVLELDDLSDGLHPNESGHEKIFQHVRKFLLEKKWL